MQKYCMLDLQLLAPDLVILRSTTTIQSVQVARRTGKSVDDAVGFLSSLLELCETTVVRVCV